MHPVPEDHGLGERQPRPGTIPLHEFFDRGALAALSIGAGKAVEELATSRFGSRSTDLAACPFALRFCSHQFPRRSTLDDDKLLWECAGEPADTFSYCRLMERSKPQK